MNNLSDTYFFAVSNQSSTFLRPRFIQIVVLEFTHFELVYILVFFLYTLHGGVMKSSVNLAKLVVVILSCALDGVSAGENRGKCVKKGRTRATQDIYDDSRSLFTANGRFAAREEERFVICFRHRNETSALKTVRISHNQIRPRFNLSSKSFFNLCYALEWLGIKPLLPRFTLDTRSEIHLIVLKLSCMRSPTPV